MIQLASIWDCGPKEDGQNLKFVFCLIFIYIYFQIVLIC